MNSETKPVLNSPKNDIDGNKLQSNPSSETISSLPDNLVEKLKQEPFHFASIDLYEALLRPCELPESTMPDGTPKENKFWARELAQWFLGGRTEVGANLAITMLATQLEEYVNTLGNEDSQTDSLITQLATAEARLAWGKIEDQERQNLTNEDALITIQREFLTEKIEARIKQLKALQEENRLKNLLPEISRNALSDFIKTTQETDVIFGRLDQGFFDFIYITGPWDQLAVREEPRLNREQAMPFIGFALLMTRRNPNNGALEFACSIDREPGAVSVRPTYQTSATRLPKFDGIHWVPREGVEEAWLQSVQEFLTRKKLTSGVEVFSINSNPSRMVRADQQGIFAKPSVLTVRLDMDSIPEDIRVSAQELVQGKHWLNLEQSAELLVVPNNGIPTVVNEFAAGAIGAVLIREYPKVWNLLQTSQEEIKSFKKSTIPQLENTQHLLEELEADTSQIRAIIGQLITSITALSLENSLTAKNNE